MGEKSSNETPSDFYFACRNNDMETVRCLLDELPLEKLDHMEPNGSTALHAACYFKHIDIIKLLLDRGFTRRVLNKYDNTPFDESETEDIRQLFTRPKTSNRFGGDISYEREKLRWIVINGNEQNVIRDRAPDTYNGNRLEYGTFHGDKILQELGDNMPRIDAIRRLFRRAVDEKDCNRLIQAYTAETDFCNRVEDYVLTQKDDTKSGSSSQTNFMSEFIDTIYFNRQLHQKYQFQGICYRSIRIKSDNDLNIYKIGTKIINRSFISTTKHRQFAEEYVRGRDNERKYVVIISFEIRQNNKALDIEKLSEFSHEKEVLIMNNSIFKVMRITPKSNFDVEIELRESKSTRVDQQKDKQGGILGLFHLK
jgi:hypothetical protein